MTNEERKEKAFSNWRAGAFYLSLPNGNHISTTWAGGSYSENHYERPREVTGHYGSLEPSVDSDTVEVMVTCGEKLLKRLEKKLNEGCSQPFAYLKFDDWLYLVNAVANEKTK